MSLSQIFDNLTSTFQYYFHLPLNQIGEQLQNFAISSSTTSLDFLLSLALFYASLWFAIRLLIAFGRLIFPTRETHRNASRRRINIYID
jgi:hypothetical protein